ncbi:MAG: hypothetical protein ACYCZY_05640 [Lacisediminihabitans sp.]
MLAPTGGERDIPAAIRPDPGQVKAHTRLDVPLLVGIVLCSVGLGLIVYGAIVFSGAHG